MVFLFETYKDSGYALQYLLWVVFVIEINGNFCNKNYDKSLYLRFHELKS